MHFICKTHPPYRRIPGNEHRYQLIVKVLVKFDELCNIRAELCAKGYGICTLNDDTIEAMYWGDNLDCWKRIGEFNRAG